MLLLEACSPSADSKVARRATAAEMPGVIAPGPIETPKVEEVPEEKSPPARVVMKRPCHVLLERACSAIGMHSDECQEGRGLVPLRTTPAQDARCQSVLDVNPTEYAATKHGLNPCRRLIRAVCRGGSASGWECKQTRKDASRLWRTGQGELCLGDLLLLELRGAIRGEAAGE